MRTGIRDFFSPTATSAAASIGGIVLTYNDTVVGSIDTKCVGAGLDDAGTCDGIFGCLEATLKASNETPSVCQPQVSTDDGGATGQSRPIIPSWHRSR